MNHDMEKLSPMYLILVKTYYVYKLKGYLNCIQKLWYVLLKYGCLLYFLKLRLWFCGRQNIISLRKKIKKINIFLSIIFSDLIYIYIYISTSFSFFYILSTIISYRNIIIYSQSKFSMLTNINIELYVYKRNKGLWI